MGKGKSQKSYAIQVAIMAGLILLAAPPVWAAVLNSVQNGSVTIPAGSVSQTVTITSVDTTKAFLVFGAAFDDAFGQ